MRRPLVVAIVLAILAAQLAYGATSEGSDPPPLGGERDYVAGELSVKLGPALQDEAAQAAFAAANGTQLLSRAPETGWVRLKILGGGSVEQKAAALRANPLVISAIPILLGEYFGFPQDPPNDPRWDEQWGARRIGMRDAWQIAGGGSTTRPMAIVDTGVDTNHPDLGSIVGKNFAGGSSFDDACGHGTLVAGVAAAFTNNGKGIAGVAYNAPIWSLRISGAGSCQPDIHAAHDAIVYAVNNGAYAINASWGFESAYYSNSDVAQLKDAIEYAWSQHVPIVAAVGQTGPPNSGEDGFNFLVPARWAHVITVGGTDTDNHRCVYSVYNPQKRTYENWGANYGDPGIDVSAPCEDIITTTMGGGYDSFNGTSLATPFVAGVVFLMKSEHPNWTSDQIKTRLQNTADKVGGYDYSWRSFCGGQSKRLGCGLVDAAAAVN